MTFAVDLSTPDMIVIALMALGVFLSVMRLLLGPHTPDRIVAADTLSVIITATLVLLAFWFDSAIYLDVALIYGALSFVGVVALARIIERGNS